MELSAKTQTKAIKIIELAQKKDLISGCSPLSIAAASLYISAIMNKEKRKQKEVTDVTGITEVTLRNRCREMKEALKLDVEIRKK